MLLNGIGITRKAMVKAARQGLVHRDCCLLSRVARLTMGRAQ
ncbi:MAG: hypothetical protein ACI9LO_001586 [Planctomycetota bacterium]|jgi:hypothetical protein